MHPIANFPDLLFTVFAASGLLFCLGRERLCYLSKPQTALGSCVPAPDNTWRRTDEKTGETTLCVRWGA